MAIIRLNINNFKRDLGGIANRLIDNVANKIEQKLENAVEDAFAKGLKKIGLSDGVARDIASRFSDSISVGRADNFFRTSTAEQDRVSPQEIENKFLGGEAARLGTGTSETTFDAVQRINTADITAAAVMQFPDQLGEYYMVLDFQSYSRPSPQMEAIFKRFKTIVLPIPRDLKESFDLDVSSNKQGAAGGLADLGVDLLRGAGEKAGGEFAILYSFAAQALEGPTADILGQAVGAVPNPHLQAIFSGVELRNHTFQWTFAPRNPQESINLKAIIKEIKKNNPIEAVISDFGSSCDPFSLSYSIPYRPPELLIFSQKKTGSTSSLQKRERVLNYNRHLAQAGDIWSFGLTLMILFYPKGYKTPTQLLPSLKNFQSNYSKSSLPLDQGIFDKELEHIYDEIASTLLADQKTQFDHLWTQIIIPALLICPINRADAPFLLNSAKALKEMI